LSDFNRLLQCNLGRSRRTHDLLLQTIREGEVALATVAEPYRVPDAPNWIGNLDGLTAVTWTLTLGAIGALLDRGSGYVAVEWTGISVVAAYVSPNSGLAAFEDFLDDVGECVKRCFPGLVLVLGDFNANSTQWGNSATNTRGRWLTDWAAGLGLLLVNKGTASTCVARRESRPCPIIPTYLWRWSRRTWTKITTKSPEVVRAAAVHHNHPDCA
jgi:hypothetical protein